MTTGSAAARSKKPQSEAGDGESSPCVTCAFRQINLCGSLNDADVERLRALGGVRTWKSGDVVFRADAPQTDFFKVTKGFVSQAKLLDDGRRQVVGIAVPGDCVGYISKNGRYTFEGVALGDGQACSFDRAEFDRLCLENAALAAVVTGTLTAILSRTAHLLSAVGQLDATERVAFLMMDLISRLRRQPSRHPGSAFRVRLEDVSDLLGMRIETASRAIRSLVDSKIVKIARPHGYIVIDEKRLAQLAKWADLGPDARKRPR
jgi:CRP/FNR family transcriptional regulator